MGSGHTIGRTCQRTPLIQDDVVVACWLYLHLSGCLTSGGGCFETYRSFGVVEEAVWALDAAEHV